MTKRAIRAIAKYLLLSVLLWPLGVFCHEFVGHGLVGVACGGQIERIEILTIQIWPTLEAKQWEGQYGTCIVVAIPTSQGDAIVRLGGALSTFCVAIVATGLLVSRNWGRFWKPMLITLSFWWLDLLTYTLPSWGLPRSIFWGQSWYSEPYDAAVALGMPGRLFQALAIAGCVSILAIVVLHLYFDSKRIVDIQANQARAPVARSLEVREHE